MNFDEIEIYSFLFTAVTLKFSLKKKCSKIPQINPHTKFHKNTVHLFGLQKNEQTTNSHTTLVSPSVLKTDILQKNLMSYIFDPSHIFLYICLHLKSKILIYSNREKLTGLSKLHIIQGFLLRR